MMRRPRLHRWILAIAGLILASTSPAPAAPQRDERKPGAAQPARTDLYGDPLPPGAIARLGTIRDNIGSPSGDVVLSPDGQTVTATAERWWIIPLRLWDTATGRVLRHLRELEPPAPYGAVRRVAFSHDGKLLAAGDTQGTVRVGRIDTGRKLMEIPGPHSVWDADFVPIDKAPVTDLAFLPGDTLLAVAYQDGAVWLSRVATGERVRSLALDSCYELHGSVFSPDGKIVSLRRLDGSLTLRDTRTGREISRLWRRPVRTGNHLTLGGQPLGFSLIDSGLRSLSPDKRLLAVAGPRGMVRVWHVAAGREVRRFRYPRPPARSRTIDIDETLVFHLVFSADGKLLAAEDTRESTCLWDVATGRPYRRFPYLEIGHGLAFTPDGKRLISGGTSFRHWDIARCREIRRFPKQEAVKAVAFGPGGRTAATAVGTTVRLWEASTGREIRRFAGQGADVYAVALSPDGKTMASGDGETVTIAPAGRALTSESATLILWDVATGREVRRIPKLATSIYSLAFTPDGQAIAACDHDGARLWEVATGREIRRFPVSRGTGRGLSLAPDGKTLAVIANHLVILWDLATGREKDRLGHPESVNAAAFAPGAKTLATADVMGCIATWDVATGQGLGQFQDIRPSSEEPPWIPSLAFLPDGKTLVSGSVDHQVRLWDTATGRVRRRLEGHAYSVNAVAVAPDGKALASASEDGTVLIWDPTLLGPG
jgi:WD40 repeat protein